MVLGSACGGMCGGKRRLRWRISSFCFSVGWLVVRDYNWWRERGERRKRRRRHALYDEREEKNK